LLLDLILKLGINIGVLALYFKYSWPSRRLNSGSSMDFSSQTLKQTKSGVKMKNRETDLNTTPRPKSRMNTPVSIGFLIWAYGPFVTSPGGGLNGTGVPFSFRKCRTDHKTKKNPKKRGGKDKTRFNGDGKSLGSFSTLSRYNDETMKSIIKQKNTVAPTGVRSV